MIKSIIKILKTPVIYLMASFVVFFFAFKSNSPLGLFFGLLLFGVGVGNFLDNIRNFVNPKKYILTNDDYDYLLKKLFLVQDTIKSIKVEKINCSIFIKSIKNETEYIEILLEEVGLIILSDTDRHEHFDYVHTESKEAFFNRVFDELKIILSIQNIISKEEQHEWEKLITNLKE